MSIAHGFDPDVSPIYEDDDDRTQHSVHFSSADTPKRSGRISNRAERTLGTSHMFEESSAHDFHEQCAPQSEEDDEVGDSRNTVEESEVAESREPTDEVVPDSTDCLSNTFIILSAGCCLPIRHHLSKCLTDMGATVQKSVDHRTTHIVVDRYADEALVGEAMNRLPSPPLMVDIKWIQECVDQRQRCEETDYSMSGARYLKNTFKRLSTFREATPAMDEETQWLDMENDEPQEPAELLAQIRQLSERLDALQNYAPIIRFEYHSPDCPTRQRFSVAPPEVVNRRSRLDVDRILNLLTTISTNSVIRRRRSFTGFLLEHRRPEDDLDAARIRQANRDTRDTWRAPEEYEEVHRKKRKVVHNAVNDMRKTMAMNLTQIRETYQRNANINKARTPKKNKKAVAEKRKEKPVPVRADDSDIQSALASLTISSPPPPVRRKKSVEIVEDVNRRRAPLVVTRSAFINRLQIGDDVTEDDDFISDVSAFHLERKNAQKRREPQENQKNGVVFTGFSKDSSIEKRLKSILRRFKLHVSSEIDERTRCVVSRHGKRTMVVLKAICMEVAVVRPQWLEESHEDSLLLPHEDYLFDEWRVGPNQKIFESFSKIWISNECTPTREDLCWLIEKCGGRITRKPRRAGMIIAPANWEKPEEIEISEDSNVCSPLFIIDSISKGEIQEVDDYLAQF